jgi:hypothetical protein
MGSAMVVGYVQVGDSSSTISVDFHKTMHLKEENAALRTALETVLTSIPKIPLHKQETTKMENLYEKQKEVILKLQEKILNKDVLSKDCVDLADAITTAASALGALGAIPTDETLGDYYDKALKKQQNDPEDTK